MPNPEISQYHDHDTNTVYDYKDAAARATIDTVQADIRKSIISISTMANGQDDDYTDWLFMSALNKGVFAGQDQAFVRIHFNSGLVDYTKPVRFIYYFDETHGPGVYICNVVMNYTTMQNLAGHYKQGDVLDFIFYKYTYTFVLVGPSDSADLSNYYTKTETDTLLNAKVSDNPTFAEATTRANIASGETFAVILGKIKKFFADLKTVAFTGSYNDLTNTPTIPAAQIQSDWTQADNTAVDYIKNKPTLAAVATTGDYGDLSNKPTIPAAQVNADWTASSGVAQILNKPNLATVATSGEYNDLNNKPNLARVATTGEYGDLSNTPTLAAVATTGDYADLSNKPTYASVATTGDYLDLSNRVIAGNNLSLRSNGHELDAYNREIQVDGTTHLTTDEHNAINFKSGDNISLEFNSPDIKINATDTKPGTLTNNNGANDLTVPNGSWTDVTQLSLTAGKLYLVSCTCVYPANSTGLRGVGIRDNTNTPMGYIFSTNVGAGTNGEITVTWTGFFIPTNGQSYYMITRQSSGSSISNVKWRYRFIPLN